MALKFRRGTTAQKSGSLAFGEPYVNTTLGTLQIGGDAGDITLGSVGTGSNAEFAGISGSSLNITGNSKIDGNLTLGGKLTIGDATSDTVNVVASLSSSLIPSVSNAFDLGSENYFWRDLYISTGSIKFVGAAGTVVGTLSNAANGMILDSGVVANGNSSFGTSSLAATSVTGSLRVSGSVAVTGSLRVSGSVSVTNAVNITGSLVTSGSKVEFNVGWPASPGEQHIIQTEGFTVDGREYEYAALALDHYEDSPGTYHNAIRTYMYDSGSNFGSETLVGPYRAHMQIYPSGSGGNFANISVQDLKDGRTQALVYGDFVQIGNFHAESIIIGNSGSVVEISGSVRANITGSIAATNGVVSGSSQVIGILDSLNTFSGSALTRLTALEVETTNLESFTSSINTTIKSKLDADGVISGSSQILGGSGLVSGSSQITLSSTTGFSAYSTSVDSRITTEKGRVDAILLAADADKDSFAEIVTLINSVDTTNDNAFASFYTASVGRLTNLESTSASVNISVSNLNTYTGSNDTTNTTQNSRLDQLSTASGSAITRLTALEVETANLEGFSSSALTRLTALEASASTALSTNNGQGISIMNLNSTTASLNTSVSNLNLFTSSINTTIKSKLDADGVISSSAQLTTTFDTRYLNTNGDGVVSGSSQIAFSGVTGTVSNGQLANSTISGVSLGSNLATLTIGTGLSGTSYNGSGAVTIALPQAVATSSNVQFGSLGIGMAANGTSGRIDAANDIVAFSSSDIRFKENITPIENALEKISKISGNTYDWKAENKAEHGYEGNDVGVIAQEIEAVLPQLVQTRESGYKAVKYDKLVALLIEGIKEQQTQIHSLTLEIEKLKESKGL
jgi:hypothetical protein